MDLERVAGVETPVDEDDVQQEVEAYVAGSPARREPWRITNLGQADWAMRRLAECRALAERYDDELLLWKTARAKISAAGEWFETRLKEWAIEQRTAGVKTIRTAHGTIPTRESKPRISVADEGAAVEWARGACPDAIKKVETLLVSQLGETARIDRVAVAWVGTNKETGEIERLPTVVIPMPIAEARLSTVQTKLGDGYVVEIETQPAVVDVEGQPIPGLAITEGSITATVTPLGV